MEREQLDQIIHETYHFLNNKGVNFICYIWDEGCDVGGGCQSATADMGDAMVAIKSMIKHFNIDPDSLFVALQESKLDMEKS